MIDVHLKGHFAPSRFAASYWRAKSKETGEPVNAKIVNTASESGLYGNAGPGQLRGRQGRHRVDDDRDGARARAHRRARQRDLPGRRARASPRQVAGDFMNPKEGEFDRFAPENISAVVGWLASDLSEGVTGQVVKVMGGQVQLLRGWRPVTDSTDDKPWTIDSIDADLGRHVRHAPTRACRRSCPTSATRSAPERTMTLTVPDPHDRPGARRHPPRRHRAVDAARPRRHLRQAARRGADLVPRRAGAAARDRLPAGPGLLGADALRRRDAGAAAIPTRSTPRRASTIGDIPPEIAEWLGSMINMDAPKHTKLRLIVNRGFTPRQVAQHRGQRARAGAARSSTTSRRSAASATS